MTDTQGPAQVAASRIIGGPDGRGPYFSESELRERKAARLKADEEARHTIYQDFGLPKDYILQGLLTGVGRFAPAYLLIEEKRAKEAYDKAHAEDIVEAPEVEF